MSHAIPPLSVCIPTYNFGRYLGPCIESILSQSFGDFELIISDNVSDDDTVAIVNAYQDSRICFRRQSHNLGLQGNFNWTISQSRGVFIKLMCADDVMLPDVLADQIQMFRKNPNVGVVTCDMLLTDGGLNNPKLHAYPRGYRSGQEIITKSLESMVNYVGGPSNFMFRAKALAEAPFDINLRFLSDLKVALKVLARWDYANIDRPGYLYRIHENSETNVSCPPEVQAENWFQLVREMDAFSPENLFRLANVPLSPAARAEVLKRRRALTARQLAGLAARRFVRRFT
jgi:glycosyltransferase involved in cell wall biosynthesis